MSTNDNDDANDLLQQFSSFMNSLDGTSDAFANAEPMMDKVFDPTWTFMTDGVLKDLTWYRHFCRSFSEQCNIAQCTHAIQTNTGIQVTIKNTVGGVEIDPITYNGTTIIDSNGIYKIKHFQPVTAEDMDNNKVNAGKMIQRVADCDDLLQLYSSFINSFDGNPDAFANAEPIMDKLFYPSFVFLTDGGPKDLDWYRSFARSFAEHGNIAEVTNIKPTENGIRVSIKNIVGGEEIDTITYDGKAVVDENGQYKISYFEPVAAQRRMSDRFIRLAIESEQVAANTNMVNFGKMIQGVIKCSKRESK